MDRAKNALGRSVKQPRHHHWIPQCYLKNFTKEGVKSSQLCVIDKRAKKRFKTKPRNVAGSRDFNRISIKHLPEQSLETAYAKFETDAAKAILNVINSNSIDDHDLIVILNLIALLATRNPRIRRKISESMAKISDTALELTLANEGRYNVMIEQITQAYPHIDARSVSYKDMKDFYENKEYDVVINQDYLISIELQSINTVLETLTARSWQLLSCARDQGEFITCDYPVILRLNKPHKGFYPIGFGFNDVDVIFPLTNHLCLLRSFEGTTQSKEISTIE